MNWRQKNGQKSLKRPFTHQLSISNEISLNCRVSLLQPWNKKVCKALPFSKVDIYKLWIMHLIPWLCCPLKVMRRRTINDVLNSKTFAPVLVVIALTTLKVSFSFVNMYYRTNCKIQMYVCCLRQRNLKAFFCFKTKVLYCLKPSHAVAIITWFVGESQKTMSSVSGFFEVYYIVVVYYNLPLVRMSCVKKGLL